MISQALLSTLLVILLFASPSPMSPALYLILSPTISLFCVCVAPVFRFAMSQLCLAYSCFCDDFYLSLTLSFALFHFICFLLFLIRFFVHLCFCPLPCLLSRLSSKHFNVISKLLLGWYDGTASYNVKSIMKQRCIRQC